MFYQYSNNYYFDSDYSLFETIKFLGITDLYNLILVNRSCWLFVLKYIKMSTNTDNLKDFLIHKIITTPAYIIFPNKVKYCANFHKVFKSQKVDSIKYLSLGIQCNIISRLEVGYTILDLNDYFFVNAEIKHKWLKTFNICISGIKPFYREDEEFLNLRKSWKNLTYFYDSVWSKDFVKITHFTINLPIKELYKYIGKDISLFTIFVDKLKKILYYINHCFCKV